MYEHLVINHKDIQTSIKYKCEKCRFQTSVEASFENHKQTHLVDSRSANQILTDEIHKQMMTGVQLQIGSKKKPEFCCRICFKKGIEDNVFLQVQKTHTGNNTGKPTNCKICGQKVRSKFDMQLHFGRMH